MSKTEKNIAAAEKWIRKHGAEGSDMEALATALSTWAAKASTVASSVPQGREKAVAQG